MFLLTVKNVVPAFIRILSLLTCLYFFICSLSFLSDSFRILGGKNIGALFSNSDLLTNPVVGLMIGVLVTVLVQSSSTSTSIIVGLVSAGAPVQTAIPMIMGANIGTSVTNIIVALSQVGDREQFRKAFACANVHDMFNWLTAALLLAMECMTGYLETVTGWMVAHMDTTAANSTSIKKPDLLKSLTKPVTRLVVQLDKDVLTGWAQHLPQYDNTTTVLRPGCHRDDTGSRICSYLLAHLGPEGVHVGETYIGIILLAISLAMLCGCLIGMVKTLNSLLGEKVKSVIENIINADIPIRGLGWLTGYLAMVLGAILTILVQSSSVFTSTLTPLAGAGLISLERAYPLTLGSNLGTTTTSILASFAAGGLHVKSALQIALVHLMFNVTGILIFYPVPAMRWPIYIAQVLGNTTSKYRWFALVYLCFMFFIFPVTMFGLSMAGPVPLYLVTFIIVTLIIFSIVVTQLQSKAPHRLPARLRSWDFLPNWCHSLDPCDRLIVSAVSCCCRKSDEDCSELKEVIINSRTPSSDFASVTYSKLPVKKVVERQRSSNSFCVQGPTIPKISSLRVRSSHSFSNSSDFGYNKLTPLKSQTPSPDRNSPKEQKTPSKNAC